MHRQLSAKKCLLFHGIHSELATLEFIVYFKTIFCIMKHYLATKMGIASIFMKTPMHWQKRRLLEDTAK